MPAVAQPPAVVKSIKAAILDGDPRGAAWCLQLLVWSIIFGEPTQNYVSLGSLLDYLRRFPGLTDLVVVDGDFRRRGLEMKAIVAAARELAPRADVVVLLPADDRDELKGAIESGARAVMLQKDISYGLANALLHAQRQSFTYSVGLTDLLRQEFPELARRGLCLPKWEIWPGLNKAWWETAERAYLEGRLAGQAAAMTGKLKVTVTKHRQLIAHALKELPADAHFFDPLGLLIAQQARELAGRESWIRHILAALPAADVARAGR